MNFGALYRLTKPGVTYGNLITTIAGYLFASNGVIDWSVFFGLTLGTWAVIASACVINNYLDQDIDALMSRTQNRPLLTGDVSQNTARLFGAILLVSGISVLILFTNWWVVAVGTFGWVVYVWLYGALSKRKSVHGTLVGSLSGAAPILAGYVAVAAGLDTTGLLLFAVIFFWQMPEFYSISIYRQAEYAKAGVPVSSVIRGIDKTKTQIFIYTVLTVASSLLLATDYRSSWTYFLVMLVLGIRWLHIAYEGLVTSESNSWARNNFHYALIYLVVFSAIISINPWLP